MHHLIFSVAALLGSEVVTRNGIPIGLLEDVICNKDSGKLTYLIVSVETSGQQADHLYAIHHTYFYLTKNDEALVFDPRVGKDDHAFFLDLPTHYGDISVSNYSDFSRVVLPQLNAAGHRSDND